MHTILHKIETVSKQNVHWQESEEHTVHIHTIKYHLATKEGDFYVFAETLLAMSHSYMSTLKWSLKHVNITYNSRNHLLL